MEYDDWTKDEPSERGLYMFRCMETDDQAKYAAVSKDRRGHLIVHSIDFTMRVHLFTQSLTEVYWRKASA